MQRPHDHVRRGLRLVAALPLALVGLTCRDQGTTGPGLPGRAALALAPIFERAEGDPFVEVTRVRATLVRLPNRRTAIDTTVNFPSSGELSLDLEVPMTRATERFELRVRTLDATSDTAYSATETVTLARDADEPEVLEISLDYTGRDTVVSTLGIEPRDTSFLSSEVLTLRAAARKSDGTAVPGAAIGWVSRDPSKFTVDAAGKVTAHGTFANVWIVAATLNGKRDSVRVSSLTPRFLRGRVFAASPDGATTTPLAGATVQFIGGGRTVTATTGADGSYTSPGLAAGSYVVTAGQAGFVTASLFGTQITDGDLTLPSIPIVRESATPGAVAGTVRSAINGVGIPNTFVDLHAGLRSTGAPLLSTTTSADGTYRFDGVPAGTYTVRAGTIGYASNERSALSVGGGAAVSGQDLALAESGAGVAIVLTWGSAPGDLDAHLTGPTDGGRFHVYYGNSGSLPNAPHAQLDIDDTNGNGPETIRIAQERAGVYRYSVHDFTNGGSTASEALANSQAQVKVYRGGALVAEFAVPAGGGTVWTVFEMSNGAITPVNRLSYGSPTGETDASRELRPKRKLLTVP